MQKRIFTTSIFLIILIVFSVSINPLANKSTDSAQVTANVTEEKINTDYKKQTPKKSNGSKNTAYTEQTETQKATNYVYENNINDETLNGYKTLINTGNIIAIETQLLVPDSAADTTTTDNQKKPESVSENKEKGNTNLITKQAHETEYVVPTNFIEAASADRPAYNKDENPITDKIITKLRKNQQSNTENKKKFLSAQEMQEQLFEYFSRNVKFHEDDKIEFTFALDKDMNVAEIKIRSKKIHCNSFYPQKNKEAIKARLDVYEIINDNEKIFNKEATKAPLFATRVVADAYQTYYYGSSCACPELTYTGDKIRSNCTSEFVSTTFIKNLYNFIKNSGRQYYTYIPDDITESIYLVRGIHTDKGLTLSVNLKHPG